ncbi:GNAT family N-acetyltransferase [Rhizobium sp.]|jgi:predicted N-acetyltransferase YhbS|uniref:GNAT family N-acetyltransferase n=1 Tax=Rhizobium sp. TaxID=391 RepID=UPI000E81C56E|nr:GNAT family N-acetyltransferase [Rhizobium sp.]
MQLSQIELLPFGPDHIDGAFALSQQAGWPHRREDWAMVLSLSQGFVALEEGRVAGTAMATLYGSTCATVNMVIVDATMRGRGLGRKLMDLALGAAEGRECRLVATTDGLPLYEKLGFAVVGEVVQHQGIIKAPELQPANIAWADRGVLAEVRALDTQAFGADRSALFERLFGQGKLAVLRDGERIVGCVALRAFGRGEVVGPVVAATLEDAKALLSFVFAERTGHFLRVDTLVDTGLAPWLTEHGLLHVGGGLPMRRNVAETAPSTMKTYALASQALG